MKESNCKNSSMPEQELRCMHLSRDMSAPDAHISRARDARAQVMPKRVYDSRVLSGGVQASQPYCDHQHQHPNTANYSKGVNSSSDANASNANGQPRHTQQARRTYLTPFAGACV